MSDNPFGFMALNIKFKDDPKFIHLDDTLKCLAYCFIHHLDIWVQLANAQATSEWGTSLISTSNIDAGRIYNNLMVSQPFGGGYVSNTELTEAQYETVVLTFNRAIEKQPKLAFMAKKITDPYECMWEFCHYLFIPVRLHHDSIPKDIRMNSLRKWVNVVFTLPFIRVYSEKYVNAIKNVTFIQDVLNKLMDDPKKVERFMQIVDTWIFDCISRTYNKENPTQIFIRLYMNVLIIASVEILKKYCPNYHACIAVNPEYDGAWLNPFDNQHMEHLQEINKLTALVAVNI